MELTYSSDLANLRIGLRSGEDLWLSLDEGLNLIYGKNGTGKSSALRALRKLFDPTSGSDELFNSGDSADTSRQLVTAYFEVDAVSPLHYVFTLLNLFFDHLGISTEKAIGTFSLFDEYSSAINIVRAKGIFSEYSNEELVALYDEWDSSDKEARSELAIADGEDVESAEAIEKLDSAIREILRMHGVQALSRLDDLAKLMEYLREGLVESYSKIYSELTVVEANETLQSFGLSSRLEEQVLGDRSFFSASWNELLVLYLVTIARDFERVLSSEESSWEFREFPSSENVRMEDAEPRLREAAKQVLLAFENQIECPTFWIEPATRRNKQIRIGLALGRSRESILEEKSDFWPQKVFEAFDDLYESLNLNESHDAENQLDELQADAIVEFLNQNTVVESSVGLREYSKDREAQYTAYWTNRKYVNLDQAGAFHSVHNPINAISLDKEVDLKQLAQNTLQQLASSHLQEAEFIRDDGERINSIKFDQIGLEGVQEFTKRVSSFLSSLDIGIVRCEFWYSDELFLWASGDGAEFVFITDTADFGLSKDSLSSGQQYWVNAAFRICAAEASGQSYLLIADEPERGLHERAVMGAFALLAGLSATSIVATHSVTALRFSGARLLHFEKNDDGKVNVAEPRLGEDIAEAAKRFGTSALDIFSMKRALVVVEGAHDVEVVRGLAGLAFDGQLLDRLLIVPARGVKNVATTADSVIITEFTTLHILAIIDNGRASVLNDIVGRASQALKEGKTALQAIKESGISGLARDSSPEERYMFDLIERAIHRNVLGRVRFWALSVPDIVDLLPETAFGLTKSWSKLRQEYARSPVRDGFKSWLKSEYQVSISTKTVRRAFEKLDVVEGELRDILRELEIVASLSPLEFQG
jgi:energy-coupling factor transporter ATP-binding protein EcfA2